MALFFRAIQGMIRIRIKAFRDRKDSINSGIVETLLPLVRDNGLY